MSSRQKLKSPSVINNIVINQAFLKNTYKLFTFILTQFIYIFQRNFSIKNMITKRAFLQLSFLYHLESHLC